MLIERLKLKKLKNTRDLGGLQTADGRTVRYGKLIRSGKLSDLPDKTVAALENMGVTTILDLRIPAERNDHPNTAIAGTDYIWEPVICTPVPVVTSEPNMRRTMKAESYRLKKEFDGIDDYMKNMYKSIVFEDEGAKRVMRTFLRLIAENDGCLLWHCASGKDRTGVFSMIIEALLGVDERTILDDYMASRKFWRVKFGLNKFLLWLLPTSLRFKKILWAFMRTKREYLECVIDEMNARYGSVIGYCKAELGVTDEFIAKLRDKYLV